MRYTNHARERMATLGITEDDVCGTFDHAEQVRDAGNGALNCWRTRGDGKRLRVTVDVFETLVVTVCFVGTWATVRPSPWGLARSAS